MRKSSPSFCQDTPDKGSRRHWEVVMIVLTDGKDASSAYCLTTALYCPLPGQYLAIARHKTIRRERKSPLSFLLFTLHQIVWNPDKHRGSERWRVGVTLHHPSPLFTFGLRTELKRKLDLFGRGLKPLFYVPQISQIYTDFSGWRVGEGWVKSGEEASALFTPSKQLIHNNLRHFGEGWRVFLKLADYRYKLQRNLCKSVKSV